jgi:hypothetical protein
MYNWDFLQPPSLYIVEYKTLQFFTVKSLIENYLILRGDPIAATPIIEV